MAFLDLRTFSRAAVCGSLVALALALSAPAQAQKVYRCLDDRDNPIYSQRPCAEDPDAVEVVDTSRALKTGSGPVDDSSSGQLSASQIGRAVVCERREREITRRNRSKREALERQMIDYGRNDARLMRDLQARHEALETQFRKELKEAKTLCLSESRLPPEPAMSRNQRDAPAEERSWRCTVENGLVFYRHDACPVSILEPEQDGRENSVQAGTIIELSVQGEQIPRAVACKQMQPPESYGRRGSRLDQGTEAGRSGC